MRELDQLAVQAAKNEQDMNSFIEHNEFFILRCASSVFNRYITKSDDEWSFALLAFLQAIQTYDIEKGSFFSFAEIIIRRRMIDYRRTQSKFQAEITVNPHLFSGEPSEEDEENLPGIYPDYSQINDLSELRKYEIEAANARFSAYGFSFFDLTDCSPKAEKTKLSCAKAVVYLLKNPLLLNEMFHSKQLPIKIIEKNTNIPRKILERHRKYIIAAAEILSGDYPCLAEYMRFIRKELDK